MMFLDVISIFFLYFLMFFAMFYLSILCLFYILCFSMFCGFMFRHRSLMHLDLMDFFLRSSILENLVH